MECAREKRLWVPIGCYLQLQHSVQLYTHWFYHDGILSREKSIHAHADDVCLLYKYLYMYAIRHSMYISISPKISISAYFSSQNFVGARPL